MVELFSHIIRSVDADPYSDRLYGTTPDAGPYAIVRGLRIVREWRTPARASVVTPHASDVGPCVAGAGTSVMVDDWRPAYDLAAATLDVCALVPGVAVGAAARAVAWATRTFPGASRPARVASAIERLRARGELTAEVTP